MANLFQKIFKPKENKEAEKVIREANTSFKLLNGYTPRFTTWQGAIYESGLVRSAIDARARNISKLKIEILGAAQPQLQTLLRQAPNPWQTWSQFLYRASTILDNNNTLFIVPVLNDELVTVGYATILPKNINLVEYKKQLWIRYQFSDGQIGAVEFNKCGVMTKFQYENDFFGSSNDALDETMNLIHTQTQAITESAKQACTYQFMAQLNNFAKADDIAQERKRFTAENLKGSENNDGLLLFPNTYQNPKQIEMKPYVPEAEQLEHIKTNVFSYFGVNEKVLQNAAFGDEWSAFYEGAIEPFAIQFSEVMTKCVFTRLEQSYGSQIMATSNRLQYLSNRDKLDVSSQMADRGVMKRNEIRDIWNLSHVANGDKAIMRGEYKYVTEEEENEKE